MHVGIHRILGYTYDIRTSYYTAGNKGCVRNLPRQTIGGVAVAKTRGIGGQTGPIIAILREYYIYPFSEGYIVSQNRV